MDMEVDSYILFQFRKIPIHRVKKKPEGIKNGERGVLPAQMLLNNLNGEGSGDEKPGIATLSLERELRSCWKVNGRGGEAVGWQEGKCSSPAPMTPYNRRGAQVRFTQVNAHHARGASAFLTGKFPEAYLGIALGHK